MQYLDDKDLTFPALPTPTHTTGWKSHMDRDGGNRTLWWSIRCANLPHHQSSSLHPSQVLLESHIYTVFMVKFIWILWYCTIQGVRYYDVVKKILTGKCYFHHYRASGGEIENWVLVCQDATGVFCTIKVPNRPLAKQLSALLEEEQGRTHTLTHLSILSRLTNTQ